MRPIKLSNQISNANYKKYNNQMYKELLEKYFGTDLKKILNIISQQD